MPRDELIADYEVDRVTGLRIRHRGTKPRPPKPPRPGRKFVEAPAIEKGSDKWFIYRLNGLESRSRDKGMEFDLTIEWLKGKYALTHCEVTGLPFSGEGKHAFSLSIDRTDNAIGYTQANCKAVVWIYNNAKNQFKHEDLMALVMALSGK